MKLLQKYKETLPNLTGKVFVITGTSSGTGFIAAQVVAEKGGEVVLLNRASSRFAASVERLCRAVPHGRFVPIVCDLQDFASVRAAADKIKTIYSAIYCLTNNAGIMATPDEATKDGFDKQMQTNHLSHFLLTKELFPLLVAGVKEYGDARIVQHSSLARNMTKNKRLEEKYLGRNGGRLGGDKPNAMMGPEMERYAQTKLANSVFTQALYSKIERNKDLGDIRAIATHPGVCKTNLSKHLNYGLFGRIVSGFVSKFFSQDPEDGTLGLLKGMMDPNAQSGVLYGPKRFSGKARAHFPKPWEMEPASKVMLWYASELAIGSRFEL
jgi:NAD(P)-dependent dehydrogenase (short-subunit alcohol dehydrogenase family)